MVTDANLTVTLYGYFHTYEWLFLPISLKTKTRDVLETCFE